MNVLTIPSVKHDLLFLILSLLEFRKTSMQWQSITMKSLCDVVRRNSTTLDKNEDCHSIWTQAFFEEG
jgi:hypothetical protein